MHEDLIRLVSVLLISVLLITLVQGVVMKSEAIAQTSNASITSSSPDVTLEAIEPTSSPIVVGRAGDDPADIARYLLAMGATAAELSPDGETLAIAWSITGVPQLWVVPVGGNPRQLTFGDGITFFRWMSDSSTLIYGADNDGNEQPAFFSISADGKRERLVLPAVERGFRSFGDSIVDGQSFIYASTERNGLDFDIYRASLAGDSELIFEGTYAYFVRAVSPDGAWAIVTESVGEDADNLFLLSLETGDIEALSIPEPRANHRQGGFAWERDGSGFFFATNEQREFSDLLRYELAEREMVVIENAGHDVENVKLCGESGRYLAWTTNEDGFDELHVRDRSTGLMLRTPSLPEGVYSISCARTAARLAVRIDGWRTPGDVLLWDLASGEINVAFESSLAGLDPDRLVRPTPIRMPARDGVELQGLLYLPDEESVRYDGPAPVVFMVHGGPTAQARPRFNAVAQYHVDGGVAVFEPNVRGSTGLGRTYATLDDREMRLASVRDLVDMLEALRAEGHVDANRAAVVGASYGGYMVNAVLANFPGFFRAGAAMYGVSDWVTALEVASPALKASDRIEYGDIRDKRWQDFYLENSPIRQVNQIDVPVLYSHGVQDPRIDIAETETMVRALRANGIEAPFVRLPDEGHGWLKVANRQFYFRQQAEFIERHLWSED